MKRQPLLCLLSNTVYYVEKHSKKKLDLLNMKQNLDWINNLYIVFKNIFSSKPLYLETFYQQAL